MTLEAIRTVAVLGAGTMGNGIAHVFARGGYNVILRDVETRFLESAMETITKNLDREVKKGKISEVDKSRVLGRIYTTTDMSEIARADFAVFDRLMRRRGGEAPRPDDEIPKTYRRRKAPGRRSP